MISTKEAELKTNLSTYKFRKIVEELKIKPLRLRGESSFKWTDDQVNQISELGKIFFKKEKEFSELDIIEFYVNNQSNVNKTSKKFEVNYRAVYRLVKKFERIKGVIVESKIKEYD